MEPQLEFVWRIVDKALQEEVMDMWRKFDALPTEEDLLERAQEIVVIGRHEGEIKGVVTAPIWDSPYLRHKFAFYRIFVSPEYRQGGLMRQMAHKMFDGLQVWAAENQDEELAGVASARESSILRSRPRKPISPGIGAMLVNFNPSGFPVSVKWFDHVRV